MAIFLVSVLSRVTAAQSDELKMAVLWYGVEMLPRLRSLPIVRLNELTYQASQISEQQPLHLCQEPQFVIPAWDPNKKLTGGQVIALMVFGLWVTCGENEDMAAALANRWPVREAVKLAKAIGN